MKWHRDDDEKKTWSDWLSDETARDSVQNPSEPFLKDNSRTVSRSQNYRGGVNMDGIYSPVATKNPLKEPAVSKSAKENMPSVTQISLSIQLPSLALLKKHFAKFSWRGVARIALAVGVIGALIGGGNYWLSVRKMQSRQADAAIVGGAPTYAPLTSQSGTKDGISKGGNFDSKKEVYVFHDTYLGVGITVSEQPMPQGLKSDESKIAEIAAKMGAKDTFETIHGKAYVTKADVYGGQKLILSHRQLLITLQSTGHLANTSWLDYIQTLE